MMEANAKTVFILTLRVLRTQSLAALRMAAVSNRAMRCLPRLRSKRITRADGASANQFFRGKVVQLTFTHLRV